MNSYSVQSGSIFLVYRSWFSVLFFCLGILGPASWNYLPRKSLTDPVFITPRRHVQGFYFHEVRLSPKESDTLGTTNILNGHFFNTSSNRVSIFHAHWEPGTSSAPSAFGHTPELCWTGSGFRIVQLGQPTEVLLRLSDRFILFQCSIFTHPTLSKPEVVLWTAGMDGNWSDFNLKSYINFDINPPANISYIEKHRRSIAVQWALVSQMERNYFTRNSQKEFIRFSQSLNADWQTVVGNLENFAQQWLALKSQP